MPCDVEGWPPTPTDLVTRANQAVERIKQLEGCLLRCSQEKNVLEEELKTLKAAFKLMKDNA